MNTIVIDGLSLFYAQRSLSATWEDTLLLFMGLIISSHAAQRSSVIGRHYGINKLIGRMI